VDVLHGGRRGIERIHVVSRSGEVHQCDQAGMAPAQRRFLKSGEGSGSASKPFEIPLLLDVGSLISRTAIKVPAISI
jgi:hypothetical protein